MDELDVALVRLFADEPRIGVLEASRRLGVARGTVQSRLDKLTDRGVISGWGPTLDPEALGYPVTAFLTLEIQQGAGHDERDGHDRHADEEPGAEPGAARRAPRCVPVVLGSAGDVDVSPWLAGDELIEEERSGDGTRVGPSQILDVGNVGVEVIAVTALEG